MRYRSARLSHLTRSSHSCIESSLVVDLDHDVVEHDGVIAWLLGCRRGFGGLCRSRNRRRGAEAWFGSLGCGLVSVRGVGRGVVRILGGNADLFRRDALAAIGLRDRGL